MIREMSVGRTRGSTSGGLRRVFRLGTAAMVGALVLAACATDGEEASEPSETDQATSEPSESAAPTDEGDTAMDDLVSAAQAEGQLHVYTSMDPDTADNVMTAFSEEYGIEADYTRLVSGPLAARYTAEAESGTFAADAVVLSDAQFIADSVEKGWMTPLTSEEVPRLEEMPAEFLNDQSALVGITVFSKILVNTNNVSEDQIPETWEDLTDEEWQGNMVVGDPRTVGVQLAAWDVVSQEYGDEFLQDIAAQQPQWQESMVSGAQLVAAGERDIAVSLAEAHVAPLLADAPDAPVSLHSLGGLKYGFEWHAGVSAQSENTNAGKLFVNWLLTQEGQQTWLANTGTSPFPDITIPGFEPLGDEFTPLDVPAAEERRDELLTLLGLTE